MVNTPDLRPVGDLPNEIGKTAARELALNGFTSLEQVAAHTRRQLPAITGSAPRRSGSSARLSTRADSTTRPSEASVCGPDQRLRVRRGATTSGREMAISAMCQRMGASDGVPVDRGGAGAAVDPGGGRARGSRRGGVRALTDPPRRRASSQRPAMCVTAGPIVHSASATRSARRDRSRRHRRSRRGVDMAQHREVRRDAHAATSVLPPSACVCLSLPRPRPNRDRPCTPGSHSYGPETAICVR
jgi:hypothetical protein